MPGTLTMSRCQTIYSRRMIIYTSILPTQHVLLSRNPTHYWAPKHAMEFAAPAPDTLRTEDSCAWFWAVHAHRQPQRRLRDE